MSCLCIVTRHRYPLIFSFLRSALRRHEFALTILPSGNGLIPTFRHRIYITRRRIVTVHFTSAFRGRQVASQAKQEQGFRPRDKDVFLVCLRRFRLFRRLSATLRLRHLQVHSFRTFSRLFHLDSGFLLLIVDLLLLFTTFFTRNRVLKMVRFVVMSASRYRFGDTNNSIIRGLTIITSSGRHFTIISRGVFRPLSEFSIRIIHQLIRRRRIQFLRRRLYRLSTRPPTTTRVTHLPLRVLTNRPRTRRQLFRVFLMINNVSQVRLLTWNKGLLGRDRVAITFMIHPHFRLFVRAISLHLRFIRIDGNLHHFIGRYPSIFHRRVLKRMNRGTIFKYKGLTTHQLPCAYRGFRRHALAHAIFSRGNSAIFFVGGREGVAGWNHTTGFRNRSIGEGRVVLLF